jgi:redox-sensitive bicupin YhaK (pirin superfamily)
MKAGNGAAHCAQSAIALLMIRLGRVYEGLMVDVQATNQKLAKRSEDMLTHLTGKSAAEAREALARAEGSVKLAVLLLHGCALEDARALLERVGGRLRVAFGRIARTAPADRLVGDCSARPKTALGWATLFPSFAHAIYSFETQFPEFCDGSIAVMTKTETTSLESLPVLKSVAEVRQAPRGHWVGDGFPVRTIFAYDNATATSPFLLMDYAGPHRFPVAENRRGVGEHPHRGFETVTILYSGEVEHRDSGGGGGKIGPGDVQWMTAGSGVVHEEMHSWDLHAPRRAVRGDPALGQSAQAFENDDAEISDTAQRRHSEVALPDDAGTVRIIAGEYDGRTGPAKTFTPISLWDMRLKAGRGAFVPGQSGHSMAVFVLSGAVNVNGKRAHDAELVVLDRKATVFVSTRKPTPSY